MPPTTADLRRFLVDAFSDEDLKALCFDYFRDMYDAFATSMTKTQMIQITIERCVRRDALANLEAALSAERPEQYVKRFGAAAPEEVASGTPHSTQSASPAISAPAVLLRRGPIDFDWVTIPAGEFLMGSDKAKDKLAYDNETPQNTIRLPEYRIARVPVTVAQFAAFMAANSWFRTTAEQHGFAWSHISWKYDKVSGADWAHPHGPKSDVRTKQDHPVTCVSWRDAAAFCQWAGVRLPTEAEWEKAASWEAETGNAGEWGKKRMYPWGDREPNSGLCNFTMTVGDTTSVSHYPDGMSPYGLLDVAGNVWEWTSSLWGTGLFIPEFVYPYDPKDGRENPSAPDSVLRALRGGSFRVNGLEVRCSCRNGDYPLSRDNDIGFRVVSLGF